MGRLPPSLHRAALRVYRGLPVRWRRRVVKAMTPRYTMGALLVLRDTEDRLLLVHQRYTRAWALPGGLVNRHEWPEAAAARELREETGLAVSPGDLGPQVAVTSGHADLGWAKGLFRDDFFLYRTAAYDIDTTGFTPIEREHVGAHRWWTLGELAGARDPVYPFGLAELLTDLLSGVVPAEPVRLPWHH